MQQNRFLAGIFCVVAFILILSGATAQAVERLTVKADLANIRSGPGTENPVMWQVEKYHPFHILKKTGNWYYVEDYEGDRGWIHNSLLEKIWAVITKTGLCNIRSGPGTNHPIVFKAEAGVPFRVIGKDGKWLHVEHADGDTGWIASSLVW